MASMRLYYDTIAKCPALSQEQTFSGEINQHAQLQAAFIQLNRVNLVACLCLSGSVFKLVTSHQASQLRF